jgi:translocation and assembly module TamB
MRRALKISAWIMGAVAVLALLLIGGLYIAGNTDRGRVMIEKLTHGLTSGQVSLSGLAGSFPRHLTLEHLELRDGRGVWLTADRVTLTWSPLAMLARRIQVDTLHAAAVDMQRLPQASSPPSKEPVSIPRIDVGDLTVDVVNLGPELAGMPASLVLRGNAHLRSVQDMLFNATAHRINGDGDYEHARAGERTAGERAAAPGPRGTDGKPESNRASRRGALGFHGRHGRLSWERAGQFKPR